MNLRKMLFEPLRTPQRVIRHLAVVIAILGLGAGLLVIAGRGLTPPSFVLGQTEREVVPLEYPVWRQVSDLLAGRKYAVLTFDDGPYGGGVDENILAILARHRAPAIFFLVCSHFNDATRLVPIHIEGGGNLIGNHTYDHMQLNLLDPAELRHQIEDCSVRISGLAGHRPIYFRPPFGQTSDYVADVVRRSGMKQVLWNANSQDSWLKQPAQILYWTSQETSNRSILLMHDQPTTAVVLDKLLTQLEERGFYFVLPTELHVEPARKVKS